MCSMRSPPGQGQGCVRCGAARGAREARAVLGLAALLGCGGRGRRGGLHCLDESGGLLGHELETVRRAARDGRADVGALVAKHELVETAARARMSGEHVTGDVLGRTLSVWRIQGRM